MLNECHNRPELPNYTVVQDGWGEVEIDGIRTRVPLLKRIPFTMRKMAEGCVQWEKPFGAIHKGLLPAEGCEGCQWKPKENKNERPDFSRRGTDTGRRTGTQLSD